MSLGHDAKLGLWAVASIGIGGMVGGGIFAVLGLAVQLAHGGTPIAFLLAGLVALLTSYAYARLSVAFPSQGGTVAFLNRAFGRGLVTGTLNVLLNLSYVVMIALYAHAFGSYGASFFPGAHHTLLTHMFISAIIVGLTVLNARGANAVGRAEEWIVALKILILLLFIGLGIGSTDYGRMALTAWSPPVSLVAGGMIIFLAYEGFELIANTAEDVANPLKTLPRAYYLSVLFVIALYVAVSIVAVGHLDLDQIVRAKDYALAEAARPLLGELGFSLIAVAALLSTGSAINATLYGAARISYIIARDGELPAFLERRVWQQPLEGLLITAGLALLVANAFDLSDISVMGSAGFLLIFAAVNLANVLLAERTGARVWVSAIGTAACLLALAALLWQRFRVAPATLAVPAAMLALAFIIELSYRCALARSHVQIDSHPDRQ